MKKGRLEKFSIRTIAEAVKRVGRLAAQAELSFAVGFGLDVSGRVQKVVKRDGQFKLVIEPDDVSGFIVFADCLKDAEKLRIAKVRKGSRVSVRGRLVGFGAKAACLSDCRIAEIAVHKKGKTRKEQGKNKENTVKEQ